MYPDFDSTGGNATTDPASVAQAMTWQNKGFRLFWSHCAWLVILDGLLVAALLLTRIFAPQKRIWSKQDPVRHKALIRCLPLLVLLTIFAFLIQHWVAVGISIKEATKLSAHVAYTWHWFRWFWLAMFITGGLIPTFILVGDCMHWSGSIECGSDVLLVFLLVSCICLSLAWLPTLDTIHVLRDSSTEEDMKYLDFAVFLIGFPGSLFCWVGVLFGYVGFLRTDLRALAVWRSELPEREQSAIELGRRRRSSRQ